MNYKDIYLKLRTVKFFLKVFKFLILNVLEYYIILYREFDEFISQNSTKVYERK
jgi:hypothetical protein